MIASKSCITKDSYVINDIVWLKDTKPLINRDTLLVVCLNRSFSGKFYFFLRLVVLAGKVHQKFKPNLFKRNLIILKNG